MNADIKADLGLLICHATILFDTIEMLAVEASDGRLQRDVLGSIEVLAAIGQHYMDEIEGHYHKQRLRDDPVTNGQEA